MSHLLTMKEKKKRYENAMIFCTFRCSMSCPRCYQRGVRDKLIAGRPAKEYTLTEQQLETFLGRCWAQDVALKTITFTGGEPTLVKELPQLIAMARYHFPSARIRVVSNGVSASPRMYKGADGVQITNYGALNRYDYLRLRRELGRKVTYQWVAHIPPTSHVDSRPADCGCIALSLVGDYVYPCGYAAGVLRGGEGIHVTESFMVDFLARHPEMQDLCNRCLANRNVRRRRIPHTMVEAGVWESNVGAVAKLPRMAIVRKLRRFLG